MIDELVHDALAAQVADPGAEPTHESWARIEAAGARGRRRRQLRSAGALAIAVVVVGAIVAVGVTQGPPPSEKLATSPTTASTPTTSAVVAPPPAPSVAEPLWQGTSMRAGYSGVAWLSGGFLSGARTAGDGRDLVLVVAGCQDQDRFGAVVHDEGAQVSIELAVADVMHLQCLTSEEVHVRLPAPLDGRPLVDGHTGLDEPVLDGSTLLVPHRLPDGTKFQAESLLFTPIPNSLGPSGAANRTWEACYQADIPPNPTENVVVDAGCVFDGGHPLVTTAQSSDRDTALRLGILDADSITAQDTYGYCGCLAYASGPSSPHPGRTLVRTPVAGGADGHPADLVSTGLHDVVVWTDGTNWFSVATPHGLGGVSTAELIRIAQGMRPVS